MVINGVIKDNPNGTPGGVTMAAATGFPRSEGPLR